MYESKKELREKISQMENSLDTLRTLNHSLGIALSKPKPKPTGATVVFYREEINYNNRPLGKLSVGWYEVNVPNAYALEKGDDGWWTFSDMHEQPVATYREKEIKAVRFHDTEEVA